MPYAVDLEKAYQDLVRYYQDQDEDVRQAEHDFEHALIERFASAQQQNAYNNDSKSAHLHNANQTLIYCLVLALASAIPYFFRILQARPGV